MNQILIIGTGGQVGRELPVALNKLGRITATQRSDLDLTDADRLRSLIRTVKPDIIVNAAAYTAVDRAETEAAIAMQINATAPGIMAEESKRLGCLLVHYSTDYVFDGTKKSSYLESDSTAPLNVYGKSKLAGETAIRATGCRHLILRTSWVYGQGQNNFPAKIIDLAQSKALLGIVSDQCGSPTWARLLADNTGTLIQAITENRAEGTYHLASSDACTRYELAAEIIRLMEISGKYPKLASLKTATTSEFPAPAERPRNSALDCSKLLTEMKIGLPSWKIQLEDYWRSLQTST